MKTKIKACLSILAAVAVLSCGTRKNEPLSGHTVDNSDVRVKNGEVLYNMYCHKCHPGGEAGLGPSVYNKPGFAKRFQVRHGLGVMPYFKKDQISKPDLKDIALYLRKRERL